MLENVRLPPVWTATTSQDIPFENKILSLLFYKSIKRFGEEVIKHNFILGF